MNEEVNPQNLPAVKPVSRIKRIFTVFIILIFLGFSLTALFYLINQNQNLKESLNIGGGSKSSSEQNPDERDWITYTNKAFKYKLKYVNEKGLVQRNCGWDENNFSSEERFVILTSDTLKTCYPAEWMGDIDIYTYEGDFTSITSIEDDWPKDMWNLKFETIEIGSLKGQSQTIHLFGNPELFHGMPYSTDIREVRVYNNGSTYFINLTNPALNDTFEQILSTFEFTD